MQQGDLGLSSDNRRRQTAGPPAEAEEETGSEASGRENRERGEHLVQMAGKAARLEKGGVGGYIVFL